MSDAVLVERGLATDGERCGSCRASSGRPGRWRWCSSASGSAGRRPQLPLFESEDVKEGIRAFRDKREPNFTA